VSEEDRDELTVALEQSNLKRAALEQQVGKATAAVDAQKKKSAEALQAAKVSAE